MNPAPMDPLSLLAGPFLTGPWIAQSGFGSSDVNPFANAAVSGEFLQHSQPVQELTLERTIYRGDCPGERVTPIRGVSFLAPIPPAGNQRIVIRNRRTGGYTNREYGSGRRRSESFEISLGNRHHGSFLSVRPGENQFRWKVTRTKTSDESTQGHAVLMVNTRDRERYRDFRSINEDAFCPGEEYSSSRTPLGRCSSGYYKVKREGVCPDGTTIKLGTQTVYRRYRNW